MGNFKVPDILVKNCNVLVTMNKDREELRNADIHISNGYIKEIGFGLKRIDSLEIIDGSQYQQESIKELCLIKSIESLSCTYLCKCSDSNAENDCYCKGTI